MSPGWPGEPISEHTPPELNEPLGRGSLGETFASWHPLTGERIAVTRFDRNLVGDPVLVRFEAEELPRLREFGSARPGLVPISAFFRIGEDLAFAMPFHAGEDVRRYRRRRVAEILDAFEPMLECLEACHAAGFAHGGLRAENLLCDAQGRILIAGLGLSGLAQRLPGPRARRIAAGAPSLSPALRAGASEVTVEDDVFAMGALLYEWISGRPPPSGTDGPRVLPPIALPGAAGSPPRALGLAIASMLAAEPAQRPQSMSAIRAALSEARSELDDPKSFSAAGTATSAAARAAVTTRAGPTASSTAAGREVEAHDGAVRKAWLALAGLVAIGAALLLWAEFATVPTPAPTPMPTPIESVPVTGVEPGGEGEPPAPGPGASTEAQTTEPRVDSFAAARLRVAATQGLAELGDRLDALVARGADSWATEETRAAREALDTIRAALGRPDLGGVEAAGAQSRERIQALEARAETLLADSVREGAEALDADDVSTATRHFELARQLAPGNAAAATGLARAGVRSKVLELMAAAQQDAARPGGLAAALEVAREISGLDSAYAPAKRLIRDLESRRAANRIAAKLARHRQSALGLEGEERWAAAADEYEAALATGGANDFARDALPRVRARAALDANLEAFLAETNRLHSNAGRAAASRAVAEGRGISDPGARLLRQLDALDGALALAKTPVPVQLVSDGQTEVTIYHVGRQGSFGRKPLELLPGEYTVVGSRDGYRDVRLSLRVDAGSDPVEFVVRCEEAL